LTLGFKNFITFLSKEHSNALSVTTQALVLGLDINTASEKDYTMSDYIVINGKAYLPASPEDDSFSSVYQGLGGYFDHSLGMWCFPLSILGDRV
jgi:hypothetical protein